MKFNIRISSRFATSFYLFLVVLSLVSCSKSTAPESLTSVPSLENAIASKETVNAAITVFKSPSCGCCGIWVDHLQEEGIDTIVQDMDSLDDIKQQFKLGPELQSCHTGVSSDGYFFEGHIPAKFIRQFLQNPPEGAAGLTVPGMPIGSPGMEVGDRFNPYDVFLVKNDGTTKVFASISSAQEQF